MTLSKNFPDAPEAWDLLGRSYIPSDINTAIKYFQKALSLDNNNRHANDGMASCLFLNGKHNEALQYAEQSTLFFGTSLGMFQTTLKSPNIDNEHFFAACVRMFDKAHAYVDFLSAKFAEKSMYNAKSRVYAGQMDYANEFEFHKKELKAQNDMANYYLLE